MASLPDVTEVAAAVLEEASRSALDPETAVDVLPLTLPAVPAQETAAEPVSVGAVAAPPPEPAVEAPRVEIPQPDAPPAATVSQTAPENVNVSVRVNSPGDDGSVEQVNVAAAEPSPQYQPEGPQYQEEIPAPEAPAPDTAAGAAASRPAADAGAWNWSWDWNCGDAVPEIPIPGDVGTQNWTWNWNWNCGGSDSTAPDSKGGNTAQYRPVVTQYRPININISIRINSPGNNGPVRQTNVAVAVLPPALPQLRVEPTATTSNQPLSAAFEPFAPLVAIAAAFEGLGLDQLGQQSAEDECCAPPEPGGVVGAASVPQSVLVPQSPAADEPDLTPRGRFRAAVAITVRLAEASEAAARSARPAPKPTQIRPAPRRAATPTREQAAALSAAGVAPLNAPDGRLGQLVFLVVAFAFAIAFANARRSVAADVRAAGEDPDPPPDHPG